MVSNNNDGIEVGAQCSFFQKDWIHRGKKKSCKKQDKKLLLWEWIFVVVVVVGG